MIRLIENEPEKSPEQQPEHIEGAEAEIITKIMSDLYPDEELEPDAGKLPLPEFDRLTDKLTKREDNIHTIIAEETEKDPEFLKNFYKNRNQSIARIEARLKERESL